MILQKLKDNKLQALKSGNHETVFLLSYILGQIQNHQIEKKSDLTDEEVLVVLKKVRGELKESIDAFVKGGRKDLVEKNKKELQIVSAYLPDEISDVLLKEEIQKILKENDEQYRKNPKVLIGICVGRLKSKADPARIVKILQGL